MSDKIQIETGKILIAEPVLGDSSFERTVILLTSHDEEEGTVGFILNKPLDHQLADLLLEFPEFNSPVFYGGPVESNSVYYLHNQPEKLPGSFHISGDLYWGGDIERVMELVKNGEIDSSQIRFYLGYSGWSKDQLECEVDEKSWIVQDFGSVSPFGDASDMWKDCIKNLGGDYRLWANSPSDPILN